jgi:hypothetical protein
MHSMHLHFCLVFASLPLLAPFDSTGVPGAVPVPQGGAKPGEDVYLRERVARLEQELQEARKHTTSNRTEAAAVSGAIAMATTGMVEVGTIACISELHRVLQQETECCVSVSLAQLASLTTPQGTRELWD